MKLNLDKTIVADSHLGCFGNFKIGDSVCRRFCILSVRCSIEKEQNASLELLDDLLYSEGMSEKIQ